MHTKELILDSLGDSRLSIRDLAIIINRSMATTRKWCHVLHKEGKVKLKFKETYGYRPQHLEVKLIRED